MTAEQLQLPSEIAAIAAVVLIIGQIIIAWRQINLANRQIDKSDEQINLAREQIKLAQAELALVQADLQYSKAQADLVRAQMEERQQKPILRLASFNGNAVGYGQLVAVPGMTFNTNFALGIINEGKRTSKNAQVLLYIPEDLLSLNRANLNTQVFDPNGIRYYRQTINMGSIIYPNLTSVSINRFELSFLAPGYVDCLYRIYDDFGVHPEEDFGEIRLHVPSTLQQ